MFHHYHLTISRHLCWCGHAIEWQRQETDLRRMAGRPRASQSSRCCLETSAVRRLPVHSNTSRQSAPSRGWWSPWCLWGWNSRWRWRLETWRGICPGAQCCRSGAPRGGQPPRRASSACPPTWAFCRWSEHCQSLCAPSLWRQEKTRTHAQIY